MHTERTCERCESPFLAANREIKRGNGRFCSQSCSSSRPRKDKTPNVSCALCNLVFYKNPSKMRNSKSGVFFCCRAHKDEAQRLGGVPQIQPHHYGSGTGAYKYRKVALSTYAHCCADCGWDEIPTILRVHHVDGNRANNLVENLVILCGRCHDIRHHYMNEAKTTGIEPATGR